MKCNTIKVLLLAASSFFCARLTASLQIANLTDRPIFFGIYYNKKGSAIKYPSYGTPLELPVLKNAQTPSFTTAQLPKKKCSSWGLAGKDADCRGTYARLAIFSFNKDDIIAGGHQLRSIAGDPSLNTGHDFQNKGSYYIFMNQDGFDPVYGATGKKMDSRDLKQGKLTLVPATKQILESIREYQAFVQGKR